MQSGRLRCAHLKMHDSEGEEEAKVPHRSSLYNGFMRRCNAIEGARHDFFFSSGV
jgi:hypothetical protein